ncbi:1-acyl-sn-glycerol-3-phosphate acyltransferase [Novipirellula artificiosorum]|uniref:Acyltransferase n=1 Tax=Novipirellula artificiosorum TaxID=2528016 RepID=A0A5C6D6J9_9BACT|nr:1-acyl-sn-glycerol-3-phosphate acyltransferase [Novipirellula artificiosorum]TWU32450.1 Acyltransferase [Novipirellula artificiosorum]
MHPVVFDQPYEFVPPYQGRCWPWILQRLIRRRLRRDYGIEEIHCEGLDRLKQSLSAGHSILLAPNHCRPCDPGIVTELCRRAGVAPFTMASWHLFMQGRVRRFLLRRIGAFSVYREGMDRQALQAGVDILQQAKRPLVIFPEGVITRTNDRLLALMEGVSFVARAAAKKRSASSPAGQVVIHPVAIRYRFHGDIDVALHGTLDAIENRLSWRPRREIDRIERVYRIGEALLWLKEIEHFGQPQLGAIFERVKRLIDQILDPLEHEWTDGRSDTTTVARVKNLRIAILRDMIAGEVTEEERKRRWAQLEDVYMAQQFSHYPPDYVRGNPTNERLLETVEKFEEDLTDESRIHRPMAATVKVGDPVLVSPQRVRGAAEDPIMREVNRSLHEMLGIPLP